MTFPINGAGEVGLITDILPSELAPNVWSDARNVRFRYGYVEKMLGYRQAFAATPVAPYFQLYHMQGANKFWIVAGLNDVYVWDVVSSGYTKITRLAGTYNASSDDVWVGFVFNSIPILHNPNDIPQFWGDPDLANPLQNLTNWPVGTFAKTVRAYKNYLVALDITKGSTRYPAMVKWSHPADPGAVPETWDETDPTKDAGEYQLSGNTEAVIDCNTLRDTNILYKTTSTWGMSAIGGTAVFRFFKIFDSLGVAGRDCSVEFFSGKHFVFTGEDCVVHDGQNAESVLSRRRLRWLRANVNSTIINRSFVFALPSREEVWTCIPSDPASTYPDRAIVWNWKTGAIGDRVLPPTPYVAIGPVEEGLTPETWDSDTETWDSDPNPWGDTLFRPAVKQALLADVSNSRMIRLDSTSGELGSGMTSYVERQFLAVPSTSNGPPDVTRMKFLRRIWLRLDGTISGQVTVTVGSHMNHQSPVVWRTSSLFTIGTSQYIDCRVTGRLFAIKIESAAPIEWRLHGLELDVIPAGGF